jgi:hypothetical protein
MTPLGVCRKNLPLSGNLRCTPKTECDLGKHRNAGHAKTTLQGPAATHRNVPTLHFTLQQKQPLTCKNITLEGVQRMQRRNKRVACAEPLHRPPPPPCCSEKPEQHTPVSTSPTETKRP